MRNILLVFLSFTAISACKPPEPDKPFPFPYKWTDSVIDYSITHRELKLAFESKTSFKHWLFDLQIHFGDSLIDTINPRIYPVLNNEVRIPLRINDTTDLDQLRLQLLGEPWDCQLFRKQDNGKFYNEGRQSFKQGRGTFFLTKTTLESVWYIAPDSLIYNDAESWYYLKKLGHFIDDSTESYPISVHPE